METYLMRRDYGRKNRGGGGRGREEEIESEGGKENRGLRKLWEEKEL